MCYSDYEIGYLSRLPVRSSKYDTFAYFRVLNVVCHRKQSTSQLILRQFVCDVADIDECQTNNGGCSAVASCTNTEGGFTCTCPSGYAGDGTTCSGV